MRLMMRIQRTLRGLAPLILGVAVALVPLANASADVISTWDLSATLSTPADGSTSVTGSFTLDQTTSAITAFDISIPGGTVSTTDGWVANASDFVATSPTGTFTNLAFNHGSSHLNLVFDGPIIDFDGDFYLGVISNSTGAVGSGLLCLSDSDCAGGLDEVSNFSSGTATLTPATVPEPASLALLGSGLFGLGVLRRRKRKPV